MKDHQSLNLGVSFVTLVVDEFGTLARTLLHVDNDATGAVHDEGFSP
jgi:hypothetical protein